jgi:hypothetical protein
MTALLFRRTIALFVVLGLGSISVSFTRADSTSDEVLDWNAVLRVAIVSPLNVPPVPAPLQFRLAAIVHTAMFDAFNGVGRRYTPIHVSAEAPAGASRRAAVVQAAYTTLLALLPASSALYDAQLEASLAAIAAVPAAENSESIERGRAWGLQVANEILAWRAADGFAPPDPPYFGSNAPGKWRPTPPAFLPGLAPSLGHTLPFVIPSPSSFLPAGPPSLTSAEYAADVNEVKAVGELTGAVRTADQTEAAFFWAGTAMTLWNRVAASAAVERHTTLSENARLFALLNVAMADGSISCWNTKYDYEFWRPITAIRLASTDGNPDTAEQADWTPLIVTPPFPEYTSAHSSISGAAQAVLTSFFGDQLPVEGTSEGLPGVVRTWPNFSAVADEANLARIWGGIHFRTAVVDGRAVGDAVGLYVVEHAALPVHGARRSDAASTGAAD